MRRLGHRLQLGLLLAAVFAPCAFLVFLTMRVAHQDRELQISRRLEERKRVLEQAADRLRAALETIRADEIRSELEPGQTYRHPETVFVGWSEDGQLVCPWEPERDPAVRRRRDLISQGEFGSAIRACEALVGAPGGPAAAADCYRRADAMARHPLQRDYARWQQAASLEDAGQTGPAAALAERLLDSGPEITDLDGVPLKLHASQSLLRAGVGSARVVPVLESVLSSRPWVSHMSLLMVRELARRVAHETKDPEVRLAAEAVERKLTARTKVLEEAQSLETDFPRLRTFLKDAWMPFGEDLWLIGAAGDVDRSAVIFVVRGQEILRRAMIPGASRLADSRDPAGEFLGGSLPGLKLVMEPTGSDASDHDRGMERSFFSLALLLTLAATIFAAYLLWRDLQREMRVSELRAQFVSSVSHELKTPLTAIRMFAETLQMGRCKDEETRSEYLGTIVSECERLSRLVEGVLLFSKADQGKKIYRFRPIQLAEAVEAAARAMEYPLAQHGFRLHTDIRDDLPPVSADRDAIEQAVLNLLSNAMKFSGDSRDIELSLTWERDAAIIRVTDHGIGIAPEEQSRIFDKFYRAATPENQLIPGAGLGLALVWQIAQAHGGRVTVESELGRGSTFCLRLPGREGAEPAKGLST